MKRLRKVLFLVLIVSGCATVEQPRRVPQNVGQKPDLESDFGNQRNDFYRQAIPVQLQARTEISTGRMNSTSGVECPQGLSDQSVLLNKINRPFWFAPIVNGERTDYILGSFADLQEFRCISLAVYGGSFTEINSISPKLQSTILEQPKINWPVFRLLITNWEKTGFDTVLAIKLVNHPNVDAFSVDEMNRVLLKQDLSSQLRIKYFSALYGSKIYSDNRKLFDRRLRNQIQTIRGNDVASLVEYLAEYKVGSFDPEILLDLSLDRSVGGADHTRLLNLLSQTQDFSTRTNLFLNLMYSNATVLDADGKVKALVAEGEQKNMDLSELYKLVANYDIAIKRFSVDTTFEIYTKLLIQNPVPEPVLGAIEFLARDGKAFSLEKREQLFFTACPFASVNVDRATGYLGTTMYLLREDRTISARLMPCLTSYLDKHSSSPSVVKLYGSILRQIVDKKLRMKYTRDFISRNLADFQYLRDLKIEAFDVQTEDGYKILEMILTNAKIEVEDVKQISLLIRGRHAGRANENDKRLIQMINESPLVTDEIKALNQQTLTGAWTPVRPK